MATADGVAVLQSDLVHGAVRMIPRTLATFQFTHSARNAIFIGIGMFCSPQKIKYLVYTAMKPDFVHAKTNGTSMEDETIVEMMTNTASTTMVRFEQPNSTPNKAQLLDARRNRTDLQSSVRRRVFVALERVGLPLRGQIEFLSLVRRPDP